MIDINELRRRIDWGYKVANGVVSELLDRLEASEEERDTYKAVCKEWIAKTEWVQDELNSRKLSGKYLGMHRADIIKAEIDALRAKIAEMERQEPVGHMPLATKAALEAGGTGVVWSCRDRGIADEPLYALPGAKGEEK